MRPTLGDLVRRVMSWLHPHRYYKAPTMDLLGLRDAEQRQDPQKSESYRFRDHVQDELDVLRAHMEYARLHPQTRLRRRGDRRAHADD